MIRTIVYIDGFNLYYGCLKLVRHCRWLDLQAISQLLCKEHNPSSRIIKVKYFTAPIKARLSLRGIKSVDDQSTYLRAINAYSPEIEIIKGKYFVVPGSYNGYEGAIV